MSKADLHIHSNYSDGSEEIKDLLKSVLASGIDIFALTDHDTAAGCEDMEKIIPDNVKFIPGIELTCKADDIKCHILGYGIDYNNQTLLNLVEKGKLLRRNKLDTRIKYLKDTWDIDLTKEEKDWLYSRKSVVKTHIANILVKRGLADNNLSAMKKYLDGCKAGDTRFSAEEGINAITAAGGMAVWAHPLGGEGERHLTKEEFMPQLDIMLNVGIQGLECYYSRYNEEEADFLADCARKFNLVISGGSDYHGSNKDIPLGRLNANDKRIENGLLTVINFL